MPIKSLEPFLFDNYCVGNYPIDLLKNSTIGVELSHYISRLLTFKKESFIDLVGGFPLTLLNNIESDLKQLKELNIKPIFVIDGLSTVLNFEFKNTDGLNSAEIIRANRWEVYNKNIKVDTFRDYQTPLNVNVFDIMEFLLKNDVEYLIAPYHASQQLYKLLQDKIIDVIYGSTDLLLFPLPLEKFIFCIEFPIREFKFLDKSYILNRLSISEKQFLEISMCCGNKYQPFKLNILPTGLDLTFQQLYEFTINGGSIYNTILQSPYQDQFFKGFTMLKFQPVLNLDGKLEVVKLNKDQKLPNDLHDIIGQKLPNEYYYYQSLGITNFKIIETILFGTYLERLSLDANPHKYYLALVNDVELINKIINLTTNFMHRYYQFKKYNLKIVISKNETKTLECSRLPQPLFFTTRKFLYKSELETIFEIDKFFTNFTSGLQITTQSITEDLKLSNKSELLGTSIARSLFVLELINYDGKLVKFGEILPFIKSKESLLLLLFFAKFNKQLKLNDIGSDKFDILSKILSIYHISDLKSVNYNSKISQNLLRFNSIFSKLQDQFNELVTANLLTILFNNDFNQKTTFSKQEWHDVANQNPFNKQFNSTLLGILSESFFTNFKTVDASINLLSSQFGNLFIDQRHPFDILKTGFKWYREEVIDLVMRLNGLDLLPKDVVDGFKDIDNWLTENIV